MRKIFLVFQWMAVLFLSWNLPSKTSFCYLFQIKESRKLIQTLLLDIKIFPTCILRHYCGNSSNSHLSFPRSLLSQMADEHSLLLLTISLKPFHSPIMTPIPTGFLYFFPLCRVGKNCSLTAQCGASLNLCNTCNTP